jgi:hypothetical protein
VVRKLLVMVAVMSGLFQGACRDTLPAPAPDGDFTPSIDGGAADGPNAEPPSAADALPDAHSIDGHGGPRLPAAHLVVAPQIADFGPVRAGQESAPITFTVLVGNELLETEWTGPNAAEFRIVMDGCAARPREASVCGLQVVFAPPAEARGRRTASLHLRAAGIGGAVMVSGQVLAPGALALAPAALEVPMCRPHGETPFELTNAGSEATLPLRLALDPPGGPYSLVGDECTGQRLPPGGRCGARLRLADVGGAPALATLRVEEGEIPALSRPVTSRGAPASLSPETLDLGKVVLGAQSPPQTFTLRNGGATPITPGTPTVSTPDFRVVSDGCGGGKALPPGGTCAFGVAFAPLSAQPSAATVSVSVGEGCLATATVTGTGTAAHPGGAFKPAAHNFGVVAPGARSQPVSFSLTNAGGAASSPVTVTLEGVSRDAFEIVQNDCADPLPPAGTCSVAVVFAPQPGGPGDKTATLVARVGDSTASAVLSGSAAP